MDASSSSFPDSPLSITSSIAGILTFIAAIIATIYVRFTYLRNADTEYFQVKNSLSWHKTESAFLYDLVRSAERQKLQGIKSSGGGEKEYQMYVFVLDQLVKLEERLLGLLVVAETEAEKREGRRKGLDSQRGWTVVPQTWRFPSATAVSWLPVRTKALELVRQRDALGSRVLFAQLSMLSSRVLDQEALSIKMEEDQRKRSNRLEDIINLQNERLLDLEKTVSEINYRLHNRAHSMLSADLNPQKESPSPEE